MTTPSHPRQPPARLPFSAHLASARGRITARAAHRRPVRARRIGAPIARSALRAAKEVLAKDSPMAQSFWTVTAPRGALRRSGPALDAKELDPPVPAGALVATRRACRVGDVTRVELLWIAAAPRGHDAPRRRRGGAAAATRTFRGDESRRRRGRGDVPRPRRRFQWRRAVPRRGQSVETSPATWMCQRGIARRDCPRDRARRPSEASPPRPERGSYEPRHPRATRTR